MGEDPAAAGRAREAGTSTSPQPPPPLSLAGELRFAARWSGGDRLLGGGSGGEDGVVGTAPSPPPPLPLQPTWAENPAAEQARLAAGYRVWVLEAARRSLALSWTTSTTLVDRSGGGGREAGEEAGPSDAAAAAVRAAADALAAEQRVALADLGRMWTWAPAAVAGMGETALGGLGGEKNSRGT